MNRHFARVVAMQSLYEWDFRGNGDPVDNLQRNCETLESDVDIEFATEILNTVTKHLVEIDAEITKAAPEWPFDQIAILDRNILRIACAELLYHESIPPKVAINEAIEIAKSYGSENSSKFVNGVLGFIYRGSKRYDPATDDKMNKENSKEHKKDDK